MVRKLVGFLGMTALVSSVAFAGALSANTKNKGSSDTPCGDNGNIETSPTFLWPPNHKDVTLSFTYTDPDADMVELEITAKPHNEMTNGEEINGTGNTPAATDQVGGAAMGSDGEVTVEGSARAERSGHKNDDGGRVYRFEYEAMGDDTDGCMSDPEDDDDDIVVFVPHDCRGGICKG